MIPKDDITGLILAGGRGSRMGEADKGLQIFRGQPLAQHVMQRLAPQAGKLMFNANRNQASYRAFGVPVWQDEIGDFAGPLAGIHAGLVHCDTPWMAAVPCDSPFLATDLISRLAAALTAECADLAVARTIENGKPQWQPVFCLMKTSLLSSLRCYLHDGGRKAESWQRERNAVAVDFAEVDAFLNLNTLQELHRLDAE